MTTSWALSQRHHIPTLSSETPSVNTDRGTATPPCAYDDSTDKTITEVFLKQKRSTFSEVLKLPSKIFSNKDSEFKLNKYNRVLNGLKEKLASNGITAKMIDTIKNLTPYKPSALANKTIEVLQVLFIRKYANVRQQYRAFAQAIRNATGDEYTQAMEASTFNAKIDGKCVDLLQQICFIRYAGVDIKEYFDEIREKIQNHQDDKTLATQETFMKALNYDRDTANNLPVEIGKNSLVRLFQKLRGSRVFKPLQFDPATRENTPHLLESFEGKYEGEYDGPEELIYSLRLGSPTNETFSGAVVNSDFKACLDYLAKHEKRMLYVCLLNPKNKGEKAKIEVLHALEKTHGKSYFFLAGPMGDGEIFAKSINDKKRAKIGTYVKKEVVEDDNLYKDLIMKAIENETDGIIIPDALKEDVVVTVSRPKEKAIVISIKSLLKFLQRLFLFFLPKSADKATETSEIKADKIVETSTVRKPNKNFLSEMKVLFNKIHELFFDNKKLTIADRKVLFLIFFSYLKRRVIKKLNNNYFANPCKDNIDRGNASTAIDKLIDMLLENDFSEQSYEKLRTQILSFPFMVKKQGIVGSRLELIESVVKHLTKLSPDQIAKIQANKDLLFNHKEEPTTQDTSATTNIAG
jgi:hypothetical protein